MAWFLWIGGYRLLLPTRIEPLMIDDWSTHLLGWLFFRNEGWSMPLGKISGFLHPTGTTLGYTDSIPWLALLLRPLSGVLPADFQHLGPWLAACFVGQGLAGALLVRLASPSWVHQALGGGLLVLAPTLAFRIGHPSLCAHVVLLLLIWLHLRSYPDGREVRRAVALALGLIVASVGVHPYLAVMVALLVEALWLRMALLDRVLRWPQALALVAAVPTLFGAASWMLGYVGGPVEPKMGGFGAFSTDLGALWNPMGYSRWLAPRPLGHQQYEGFAYLGLGVLLLAVLAVASIAIRLRAAVRWPWARPIPLVVAVLALAAFSLSSMVTWNGELVLDLRDSYSRFEDYVAPFRSSGRFIWPLHYFVVAAVLVIVAKAWAHRPLALTGALLAAFLVQLVEFRTEPIRQRWRPTLLRRFEDGAWSALDGRYRHLVLLPAEIWGTPCSGPAGYRPGLVVSLAYHAYRHRLTFNSGYVARWTHDTVQTCRAEADRVVAGQLDPATVYVVGPRERELLERAGASCGQVDGLMVCVRPAGSDPFAEKLRTPA